MMNFAELTGKKLAIVIMGEDENGKKEGAVFTGLARWANGHMYLDRGRNQKSFQIPDETIERIKPVTPEIADIVLNADYYMKMSIAPLPSEANPKEYIQTGLKWPE